MNAIKKIVMGLAVACAAATTQAVEIPTVTGGDEVFTNGYDVVHVFRTVGDAALTIADYPATVDILIVGGGGAGGGNASGGGGGGGVVYLQDQTLAVGAYPLAVGAGGAGVKGSYGGVGGDSTMMLGETIYVAKGGGGGGFLATAGLAGGGGGGGGGWNGNGPGGATNQETYDGAGHGTAGAAGVNQKSGGGGGGAGGAPSGAKGGDGFLCVITGEENVRYGAGGAGYNGSGGAGGGGAATKPGTFYGAGGGGAATGGSSVPGAGYQGVVIVRVKNANPPSAVDATLTGGVFSFDDGLTHSAKLDVSYPQSGWTANWTWNDGTGGHAAPEVFTEPGVYHNSVVVTADELDPFEATAEVSVSIMAPAVGGDAVITNDNYHIIHIFSNVTDAATLKVNRAEVLADILIVGGGGAGGGDCGGGGGGGGVVYLEKQLLTLGEYPLTVGAGGAKTTGAGNSGADSTLTLGETTYVAVGGGGGGISNSKAGSAGGCGGGGGYYQRGTKGGASTQEPYDGAGHGNPGIDATTAAGGGGGAGSEGSGKNGGAGYLCDITGEPEYYGAGGGGTGGTGGQGGGGAGGTNGSPGTFYGAGGGGGGSGGTKTSGAGYKGIVVVRLVYAIPPTSVDATVDAPDVPYDGEAHAVTLKVGYPMDAANCTTNWTWEGGSGEVAPTYTEPGIYTNVVRVSAPNLADYVATTTVTIAKINLANAEIDQIPTQDWTGEVIHPTPKVTDAATGLTVSTADFDFVYPTDCTKQGVHKVRIVGKDDVGHAEGEQEVEFVILADSRAVFVAEDGSDDDNDGRSDTPFKTIAHAVALARAAIEIEHGTESVTIRVKDGTYASPFVTLDIPVAIVGNPEHPENVVITDATAGKRAFTLSHADAKVAGLTITGTGYKTANGSGGHILMSAGTVEDCIIEGGRAAANSGAGKGGNVSMSGGCLRRCIVRNGKPAESTTNGNCRGANIHATGGVVENCLVTGGSALTDQTSSFDVSGATKVINCTIVNNTPGSKFGGIRLESDSAQVVNCVIYGNGGTAQKEWGNVNARCFNNCATSADAAITGGTANIGTVTGESFVNYASGDYTPAAEGALKDAGSKQLYTDSGATSETDLAHAPRFVGILDIGAYEVQPTSLLVQLSAQGNNVAPGVPVTLTATALGASETVSWAWSVNGAGFAAGEATYALDTSVAGVYTVTAKATAGGETAEATHVIRVIAAGSTVDEVWVGQTGDDVNVGVESSPFATIAHAKEFLAAHGAAGTIHLLPGAYFEYGLVLDGAYVVQGEGATRDDVIVNARSLGQAIKLNHANALVENLTVKDGYLNGNGANVYIVLGTVRNCCIRDGATQGNNCGANVYMDNGRLANCQILDGVVCRPGTTAGGTFGAGVYAKGNAVVENCFFKGNYKNKTNGSGYSTDNLGMGAVANGSSRFVNCTFVANHGPSSGGSAIQVVNANARVVNCVFFDNMVASVKSYTAAMSYGTSNPGCFVNCASEVPVPSGNTTCLTGLTANDFKDYANGDYRPAKGDDSILKGAGVTKSEYEDYGATSETDLIGTLWGKTLDIGCYAAKAAGLMLILR